MTRRSARSLYLRRLVRETGGRLVPRGELTAAEQPLELPNARPVRLRSRWSRAVLAVAARKALGGDE